MTSTWTSRKGAQQRPRRLWARRPWREWVRRLPGLDHGVRAGVFVVGLMLVLGGAALWLFSALLTVPLVFAGLWVWSWEFAWARRRLRVFRASVARLWERIRRQPVKWAVLSAVGVASGVGVYWAWFAFSPV